MSTGDTFGYVPYTSDTTELFQIKMSLTTASAGGFGGISPVPIPGVAFWPWKAKDLRHVTGVNAAGTKRSRLPIATPTNALFVGGGTFAIDAGVFRVTGFEGENRKGSHLR